MNYYTIIHTTKNGFLWYLVRSHFDNSIVAKFRDGLKANKFCEQLNKK